jgi:hypothetical protein
MFEAFEHLRTAPPSTAPSLRPRSSARSTTRLDRAQQDRIGRTVKAGLVVVCRKCATAKQWGERARRGNRAPRHRTGLSYFAHVDGRVSASVFVATLSFRGGAGGDGSVAGHVAARPIAAGAASDGGQDKTDCSPRQASRSPLPFFRSPLPFVLGVPSTPDKRRVRSSR